MFETPTIWLPASLDLYGTCGDVPASEMYGAAGEGSQGRVCLHVLYTTDISRMEHEVI